jgi:hypothetical protein
VNCGIIEWRHQLERVGDSTSNLSTRPSEGKTGRESFPATLPVFWLRDESLEESDNLPDPDVLAQEIIEDLEAALEQFREIARDLGSDRFSAEPNRSDSGADD